MGSEMCIRDRRPIKQELDVCVRLKQQLFVDAAVVSIPCVFGAVWLETMILNDAKLVPKIGTI